MRKNHKDNNKIYGMSGEGGNPQRFSVIRKLLEIRDKDLHTIKIDESNREVFKLSKREKKMIENIYKNHLMIF